MRELLKPTAASVPCETAPALAKMAPNHLDVELTAVRVRVMAPHRVDPLLLVLLGACGLPG